MNYPTTDQQFLADMLRRTIDHDQITIAERGRLDQIATQGFSRTPVAETPAPSFEEPLPGATRVER